MVVGERDDRSTTVERVSEQELAITRIIDGPARTVFDAWTKPDLFQRWWAPASFGVSVLAFEADIRTGGSYRLVMRHAASEQTMTFFGRYLEVTPPSRLVWTNEEADGGAVTTVAFETADDATRLTVTERFPSRQALDEAVASGSTSGWSAQLDQLDRLVATLGPTA